MAVMSINNTATHMHHCPCGMTVYHKEALKKQTKSEPLPSFRVGETSSRMRHNPTFGETFWKLDAILVRERRLVVVDTARR